MKIIRSSIGISRIVECHPIATKVDAQAVIAKDGITADSLTRAAKNAHPAPFIKRNDISCDARRSSDQTIVACAANIQAIIRVTEIIRAIHVSPDVVALN